MKHKILTWLISLLAPSNMCHKERLGYTCHHTTASNGTKECGDE